MESPRVTEKARYLLSAERGTVFKDPGGRISVALIYPNRYRVGMSNLGFQTIYRHLNRRDDVVCERAFAADPEDEVELRRTGRRLCSLESGRPLAGFDILAFSVSFENDYPHVLTLLDLAGLPLEAHDRNARHPLVMLGGAITLLNPEPLARFVDLVVVGEAEETLDEYFDLFGGRYPSDRAAHLREAAAIPGIYVPGLYPGPSGSTGQSENQEGKRRRFRTRRPVDLSRFPAYSTILTPNTEFADTLLIEIARGCPWGCHFCAAGHIYRPFRALPVEGVLGLVRERMEEKSPPLRKVGLVSSAVCDYPDIDRLCEELRGLDLRIGVSSLRADRLSDTLLRTLVDGGLRTLTLAPEAGSGRLREAIGKRMDTEAILDAADRAVANGIPNLRLYGMIGLPSETDEDVAQLVDLTLKVRQRIDRHGSGVLTLSMTPFVPKPHTPFQRCRMESRKEIRRKLGRIKRALRRERGIRVKAERLSAARFQALLSRGDRQLGDLLLAYHRGGGRWEQAARDVGIDPDEYLGEIPPDAALPWEFL